MDPESVQDVQGGTAYNPSENKAVVDERESDSSPPVPYRIRNMSLIALVGFLNGVLWVLVTSASTALATDFKAESRLGAFGISLTIPALMSPSLASLTQHYNVPYFVRCCVSAGSSAAALVCLASAQTFDLVIVGAFLTGLGQAYGEVTILSYLTFFDPKSATAGYGLGTGGAGFGGSGLFLFLSRILKIPNSKIFLWLLPLCLVYVVAWVFLKPNETANGGEDVDGELTEDQSQDSTMRRTASLKPANLMKSFVLSHGRSMTRAKSFRTREAVTVVVDRQEGRRLSTGMITVKRRRSSFEPFGKKVLNRAQSLNAAAAKQAMQQRPAWMAAWNKPARNSSFKNSFTREKQDAAGEGDDHGRRKSTASSNGGLFNWRKKSLLQHPEEDCPERVPSGGRRKSATSSNGETPKHGMFQWKRKKSAHSEAESFERVPSAASSSGEASKVPWRTKNHPESLPGEEGTSPKRVERQVSSKPTVQHLLPAPALPEREPETPKAVARSVSFKISQTQQGPVPQHTDGDSLLERPPPDNAAAAASSPAAEDALRSARRQSNVSLTFAEGGDDDDAPPPLQTQKRRSVSFMNDDLILPEADDGRANTLGAALSTAALEAGENNINNTLKHERGETEEEDEHGDEGDEGDEEVSGCCWVWRVLVFVPLAVWRGLNLHHAKILGAVIFGGYFFTYIVLQKLSRDAMALSHEEVEENPAMFDERTKWSFCNGFQTLQVCYAVGGSTGRTFALHVLLKLSMFKTSSRGLLYVVAFLLCVSAMFTVMALPQVPLLFPTPYLLYPVSTLFGLASGSIFVLTWYRVQVDDARYAPDVKEESIQGIYMCLWLGSLAQYGACLLLDNTVWKPNSNNFCEDWAAAE